MTLKPPRLPAGGVIGIISPASAPPDPCAIDHSIEALNKLGFKVKLASHARSRFGFLAGNDRDRASDLMQMFSDCSVRGILCIRGGYGTARLVERLDYTKIHANPKVFVGYSDITSLHCAFLKRAGLVSFHGPMLNSDFIKPDMPAFTLRSFLGTVTSPAAYGSICQGYRAHTVNVLRRGISAGELIGGNLTLLCATLGTADQPDFKNKILFLEDLEEPPYRFDRMLTQLLNAGLLQQVAGVAIGLNANCHDPRARRCKEYRQTLEDVFRERLLPLKVPVVAGLPFGHVRMNATLPIGVRVTLDAVRGDLIIDEPAVS